MAIFGGSNQTKTKQSENSDSDYQISVILKRGCGVDEPLPISDTHTRHHPPPHTWYTHHPSCTHGPCFRSRRTPPKKNVFGNQPLDQTPHPPLPNQTKQNPSLRYCCIPNKVSNHRSRHHATARLTPTHRASFARRSRHPFVTLPHLAPIGFAARHRQTFDSRFQIPDSNRREPTKPIQPPSPGVLVPSSRRELPTEIGETHENRNDLSELHRQV